jgi:hypothetical protein
MIPVIAAGIAGLATFVGASLLANKKAALARPNGITKDPSAPGFVPFVPPAAPPGTPVSPNVPGNPFAGIPLASLLAPSPDGTSHLAINPDGSAHTLGTAFVSATTQDNQSDIARINKLGISAFEFELLRSGVGKFARVTTNDPSPSGDLIIRTAPNPSAPQIDGGGADKNGTVTIIRDVDSIWSEVFWRGGDRPLGQGFAKRQFLTILPNPTLL